MTPSERGAKRVRLLTAAVLLAVFAAGALFGAGLARWAPHPGPGPGRPPLPRAFHQLGLTPAQHRQAAEIMERYRPQLDAIVQETFPRVRQINDRIAVELRGILTDEQRARLDELESRRGPHRMPGLHPPPGEGPQGGPPFGLHPPPPRGLEPPPEPLD